jgi:hypothetical protein
VGSEPLRSNSTGTSANAPPIKSRARRPIRSAAAQCELDSPRTTGPITSLNMLASTASAFPLSEAVTVKTGDRGRSQEFRGQSSIASGLVLAHFDKET